MRFINLFFSIYLVCSSTFLPAYASDLPVLSDATSSAISRDKEYRLGQAWARQLRGSVQQLNDPLTYSYLHDLLWQLTNYSQLQDKRLDLIVPDNATLNAFAVPGGIVGIHGGLLLTTEQEDELASVIAHELAHLSQRHFAAQLEESRRNRPFTLAAMLAGLLIAAADGQAGAAAITSSVAFQQSSYLAFSRQNEREADQIGMQTLADAGIDPTAMPRMFSRMQQSLRLQGSAVPEFLLTHPITQSRLADSLNRAAQYPTTHAPRPPIDFQLVKKRAEVHYANNPQTALNHFKTASQSGQPIDQYGYALAALRLNQFQKATTALDKLPADWQQHLFIRLTRAEINLKANRWREATRALEKLNTLYPGHYAVQSLLARGYMGSREPQKAVRTLKALLNNYPTDTAATYLLAEAYGQTGNSAATHRARINYFLLTGQVDTALKQIAYARHDKSLNNTDKALLDQLETEAKEVREDLKMDF